MPDSRSHRGAHPEDARDFAAANLVRLRAAVDELCFLFGRGYSQEAALKLVGDHHQLTRRQRLAVLRASCSDAAQHARRERRVPRERLADGAVAVDGFNCLITVEAWLSDAPLFRGRDTALRDLASVHGSYRSVEESEQAARLLVEALLSGRVRSVRILLDRPVGNSGRTRALFEHTCRAAGLCASVELCDGVDRTLVASGLVVASSDGWLLDRVAAWTDLPALAIAAQGGPRWLVDLSSPYTAETALNVGAQARDNTSSFDET